MAKTYKQKIYDELNGILERYPNARVSDVIWALEAMAETRDLRSARGRHPCFRVVGIVAPPDVLPPPLAQTQCRRPGSDTADRGKGAP